MSLLPFRRSAPQTVPSSNGDLGRFLDGFSIEVMPRTAAKIEDFRALLPAGTRIYIAHIEGTPIEEMVATARRLRQQGFVVMPHFPARIIKDKATLLDWVARYQGEADIRQGLILAGGSLPPMAPLTARSSCLTAGCSTLRGLPIYMSQATPRAIVTLTRMAGARRSMPLWHGNKAFPSKPMRRWRSPRNSRLRPRRLSPGPIVCGLMGSPYRSISGSQVRQSCKR